MNKKPQLYFTSDWHIGHENVIHFSNRPFQDVEQMAKGLVSRYNSVVSPNGVCYFLGDMGFGNIDVLNKVITQLNGTKILILGNHDASQAKMYRAGFDVVMNGAIIQYAGYQISMTHCPLRGITREDTSNMRGSGEGEHWHGEFRHTQFSIPSWGQYHLHGHIHSPNSGKSVRELGKQFDVGVDANNYTPVSISRIESWIAQTMKRDTNECD
jgi:calcineurin-like phosphoesterase family protein